MKPDSTPHAHKNDAPPLPEPSILQSNPEKMDEKLDRESEQSMDASDPPSVTQPKVKIHHGLGDKDRKDNKVDDKGRSTSR